MVTEERIVRLERQIRRHRIAGIVTISAATLIFLVGQGREPKPRHLLGKSLTLKADDGWVWLEARGVKNGSTLRLNARQPFGYVELRATTSAKHFLVVEPPMNARLAAGVAHGNAHLTVLDRSGVEVATVIDHPDRHGAFIAADRESRTLWKQPAKTRWPLEEVLKEKQAHDRCAQYLDQVLRWWTSHRKMPSSLGQIVARVEDDPWGNPYKLIVRGEEFYVVSLGPDGKEGTEDDISIPTPKDDED